jgi:pyruvate dehydrogenase E2 component (dihydrolipoamide acetyltransferase)
MSEFTMPSLGADMERGVLVEWYVREGDPVERGQVIAAVDTDKAVVDVEVFRSGVIERLLVEPGTTVPVGTPLALIADRDDAGTVVATSTSTATDAASRPVAGSAVDQEDRSVIGGERSQHPSVVRSPLIRHLAERLDVDVASVRGTGVGGRVTRADVERAGARPPRAGVRASPRARRQAAEWGLDVSRLQGTGPGGAVVIADVVDARDVGPVVAAEQRTAPPDRARSVRQAVARLMERSSREIPHFHLTHLVDLTELDAHVRQVNADREPAQRLAPAAVLFRAVALAAAEVPELNGYWQSGGFQAAERVDLAFVVALRGGGVIAPVVHDADRVGLDDLMQTLRGLVERARRGSLRSSELQGASLTFTHLGDRGVDTVHGLIHPPQVALVGAGRVRERPVVVDGEVVARPSVVLSLAVDHRAADGTLGSRMLRRIESALKNPGSW